MTLSNHRCPDCERKLYIEEPGDNDVDPPAAERDDFTEPRRGTLYVCPSAHGPFTRQELQGAGTWSDDESPPVAGPNQAV